MSEAEALEVTDEQRAEMARIDGQVEGEASASGVVEGQTGEGESDTFPRAYVEQLRKENADRRKKAEETEARNVKLVRGLLVAGSATTAAWPIRPTCWTALTPRRCWTMTAASTPRK